MSLRGLMKLKREPLRRAAARAGTDPGAEHERSDEEESQPGGTGAHVALAPDPLADAEVEAALEDIDVDAPRVGIVMGSKSDLEIMQQAAKELEERGILHEL